MDVLMQRAEISDKETLFRLLQYSLYEESLTDGNEIGEDALFDYPWFDAYFAEPDREAYLIRCKRENKLLGLAMIREENGRHSIAEFMILPKYRRQGIGTKAAFQCFDQHKGSWMVRPSYGSETAKSFWQHAIAAYTGNCYSWSQDHYLFYKET